jgi:two-component system, NarL family, response regulator LiaR
VPESDRAPVRVAVANDFELVLAGMAAALAAYADRVEIVEVTNAPEIHVAADVVLVDTFGRLDEHDEKLQALIRGGSARVLIYSWDYFPVDRAVDHGAYGYVFKGAPITDLVEAIEAVHAGEIVRSPHPDPAAEGTPVAGDWPGKHAGLTAREAEILTLVTAGHSNQEIAGAIYLSINTVKTHLRAAYAKIGVTRRSQAVAWGLRNGLG